MYANQEKRIKREKEKKVDNDLDNKIIIIIIKEGGKLVHLLHI